MRPLGKLRSPFLYGGGKTGYDFEGNALDLINGSELLPRFFNRDFLLKTLGSGLNRIQYNALLTIILYVDRIERNMRE